MVYNALLDILIYIQRHYDCSIWYLYYTLHINPNTLQIKVNFLIHFNRFTANPHKWPFTNLHTQNNSLLLLKINITDFNIVLVDGFSNEKSIKSKNKQNINFSILDQINTKTKHNIAFDSFFFLTFKIIINWKCNEQKKKNWSEKQCEILSTLYTLFN